MNPLTREDSQRFEATLMKEIRPHHDIYDIFYQQMFVLITHFSPQPIFYIVGVDSVMCVI